MKKKYKKLKIFGLITYCLFNIFLIYLICSFGYSILYNKYINSQDKVDKETVSYISFLFEYNDSHVIEVKKPKIVSDEVGKLLFDDSCFTFELSLDKEQFNDSLEYVVTADPIGETIDDKYIKFYLTDENDKPLSKKSIMTFSEYELDKDISSKVIYKGKFTKNKTKQTLKLRIWISDKYDDEDVPGFSYQLNILMK